jgi:hypothetical protein
MYLEEEFGYGSVAFIEPSDAEDRNRGTRSFLIDNQGRQRIYFSTEVLEDTRDPRRVLQNLNGSEVADLHQESCGCACYDDDRGTSNSWRGMNFSKRCAVVQEPIPPRTA